MKKNSLLLLFTSLLLSCSSLYQVRAENNDSDFIASELEVTDYNYKAIDFERTSRGLKITAADNHTSTDAYLRTDNINKSHSVGVDSNRFIAIRFRSNYDPEFALRILSTTGFSKWNDFLYANLGRSIENEVGSWKTCVFDLNLDKAQNVSESDYSSWIMGDYKGVSFNITNNALFNESSYLYISSFAFFSTREAAAAYSGLDYSTDIDTTGPEITIPYADGDNFEITAGKSFDFTATSYDEYDGETKEIRGVLSSGALDENNKLVEGNHTVTFTSSDISGNVSNRVLNVLVKEKDTVPPVINISINTIRVFVGTYNKLVFIANDEEDGEIECTYSYSENAVDEMGRFLEGTHTIIVKATDLTGNVATKEITIIVSNQTYDEGIEIIIEE